MFNREHYIDMSIEKNAGRALCEEGVGPPAVAVIALTTCSRHKCEYGNTQAAAHLWKTLQAKI